MRTNINTYQRIDYLDALRGLAAMMVVFYHYINWYWKEELAAQLGSLIFNGADAVSFFFVLSGFVLAYKFFQLGAYMHMGRFIFKRVFRLYPAYIVAVLVCLGYWLSASTLDETLTRILHLNYGPVWAELSMVMQKHQFYIPGWTLGVEMRYSLLIPAFIFLIRWRPSSIWIILLVALMFHRFLNAQFLIHFVLGMIMVYYLAEIQTKNWSVSWIYRARYLLVLLLFVVFNLRHLDAIFHFPHELQHAFDQAGFGYFQLSGIASAGIIFLLLINQNWQKALSHPVFLYLGKISYGIYLMHWVFVLAVMEHYQFLVNLLGFPEWITFSLFLILAIAATILSADLMYKNIEEPMIKWAKRKSRKW